MKTKKLRPYVDEPLFNSVRSLYPNFPGDDSAFLNWLLTSMLACGSLPSFGGTLPPKQEPAIAQNQPQPSPASADDELDPNELLDDDDLLGSEAD